MESGCASLHGSKRPWCRSRRTAGMFWFRRRACVYPAPALPRKPPCVPATRQARSTPHALSWPARLSTAFKTPQWNLLVHPIPDVDGNRGPAASRDSLCCFLDASSGSELSSNGHPSIGCRPSAHLARRTPYAQVVPQWMSDGCRCDPETSPRWHLHRMTDVRDLPVSVFLLAADMIDEEVSSQLFVP